MFSKLFFLLTLTLQLLPLFYSFIGRTPSSQVHGLSPTQPSSSTSLSSPSPSATTTSLRNRRRKFSKSRHQQQTSFRKRTSLGASTISPPPVSSQTFSEDDNDANSNNNNNNNNNQNQIEKTHEEIFKHIKGLGVVESITAQQFHDSSASASASASASIEETNSPSQKLSSKISSTVVSAAAAAVAAKEAAELAASTTTRTSFPQQIMTPLACSVWDLPPVIVGIAGGSGSGKTTLTQAIAAALGSDHVSYISHDSYYKDLSHLPLEERIKNNFDHPDSLDTELLKQHLVSLRRGQCVDVPIYDFTTHSRTMQFQRVNPRRIVLVDGILIFADSELAGLMDMKIYVDTEDDIRLIRRIQRDTEERHRSVDSVIHQYTTTVRPMHQLFVEPSKKKADIIVPAGQGIQAVALEMCVSRLREIINFCQ